MRSRTAAALAIALLLAGAGPGVAQSDTMKVAVGQRGKWDGAVQDLGARAGIFRRHGLELDILYTNGGGETLQAVISGSVDVGIAAGTLGVLGAFSKGAPVRIIGAQATGDDAFWYVRADGPVRSIADMAGRTMAYSTNGSSTHAAVLALIEHFRVAARPTAAGGAPATFTAVMSGQIDAGWSAPPFGLVPLRKGEIRLIARSNDLPSVAGHSIRVNIANAATLAARPDAFRRFRQAYRETVDWMYAGDDALKVYADYAGVAIEDARQIRTEFDPKEMVLPDTVSGLAAMNADAVKFKYMAQPLTETQLRELVRTQP
jgi:NitT/TauT family transport system substrate-binding protein